MWKSIVFKEWLKLKWILALGTLVGIAVTGSIFLNLKHDLEFNGPTNLWYSILFMGYQYFQMLKFVPLVIGLSVGIAQYFPETVNKRIKLSFHLPVEENRMLVWMMLCGTIALLLIFGLMFVLFWSFSIHYLPYEIVSAAVISVAPWFMAGFAVYYFVGLIVLEPVWKFWIFYGLVAYSFITLYMESTMAGAFEHVNLKFLVLTVLLSITLLFSANRFRKGEM